MYDHSMYTQNCYIKIFTFFSPSIRMSRKNVNFGDKKIKKVTFIKTKVTKIGNIDINKKEQPCGSIKWFKYFIGLSDNDVLLDHYA